MSVAIMRLAGLSCNSCGPLGPADQRLSLRGHAHVARARRLDAHNGPNASACSAIFMGCAHSPPPRAAWTKAPVARSTAMLRATCSGASTGQVRTRTARVRFWRAPPGSAAMPASPERSTTRISRLPQLCDRAEARVVSGQASPGGAGVRMIVTRGHLVIRRSAGAFGVRRLAASSSRHVHRRPRADRGDPRVDRDGSATLSSHHPRRSRSARGSPSASRNPDREDGPQDAPAGCDPPLRSLPSPARQAARIQRMLPAVGGRDGPYRVGKRQRLVMRPLGKTPISPRPVSRRPVPPGRPPPPSASAAGRYSAAVGEPTPEPRLQTGSVERLFDCLETSRQQSARAQRGPAPPSSHVPAEGRRPAGTAQHPVGVSRRHGENIVDRRPKARGNASRPPRLRRGAAKKSGRNRPRWKGSICWYGQSSIAICGSSQAKARAMPRPSGPSRGPQVMPAGRRQRREVHPALQVESSSNAPSACASISCGLLPVGRELFQNALAARQESPLQ